MGDKSHTILEEEKKLICIYIIIPFTLPLIKKNIIFFILFLKMYTQWSIKIWGILKKHVAACDELTDNRTTF